MAHVCLTLPVALQGTLLVTLLVLSKECTSHKTRKPCHPWLQCGCCNDDVCRPLILQAHTVSAMWCCIPCTSNRVEACHLDMGSIGQQRPCLLSTVHSGMMLTLTAAVWRLLGIEQRMTAWLPILAECCAWWNHSTIDRSSMQARYLEMGSIGQHGIRHMSAALAQHAQQQSHPASPGVVSIRPSIRVQRPYEALRI